MGAQGTPLINFSLELHSHLYIFVSIQENQAIAQLLGETAAITLPRIAGTGWNLADEASSSARALMPAAAMPVASCLLAEEISYSSVEGKI